jgi:hypothetical protein
MPNVGRDGSPRPATLDPWNDDSLFSPPFSVHGSANGPLEKRSPVVSLSVAN